MTKLLPDFAVASLLLATMLTSAVALADESRDVSLEDMLATPCPTASNWIKNREKQVVSSRQASASPEPLDVAMHDELLQMQAEDVRTRTPLQQAGEHPSHAVVQAVMDVDKRHLDTLHEITARGLPSREAIGSDGQSAFFLLVQHADMDPAFQEQVLAANARMADRGFRPDEAVMLSDRVALRLGKEQPYGSQLGYEDGHLQPKKPIGRLDAVEKRRASVHLMPLSDYICMMDVLQKPH